MEDFKSKIRTDCWDNALDCFGYSIIYSKRISKIEVWLRWSKVLGFIIPVALGGIVSGYYTNTAVMNWAIVISSPIALAQLIVSAYLTAIGTDERLIDYMRKSAEYSLLQNEFEQLGKYPLENYDEYKSRFKILNERQAGLGKDKHHLEDRELRMGMRYGLRNYKRACVSCEKVPFDTTPTKCDVCGNF